MMMVDRDEGSSSAIIFNVGGDGPDGDDVYIDVNELFPEVGFRICFFYVESLASGQASLYSFFDFCDLKSVDDARM